MWASLVERKVECSGNMYIYICDLIMGVMCIWNTLDLKWIMVCKHILIMASECNVLSVINTYKFNCCGVFVRTIHACEVQHMCI